MNKTFISILTLGAAAFAYADEPPPKVFAHYMTCFSATPEFYQREIELAQRYGIDGFALNCGEWKKLLPNGKVEGTMYVRSADRMYEAAKQNGTDFKLFFSPDFSGLMIKMLTDFNVGDMVKRYSDHPNQFYYEGKQFLSGYAGYKLQYESPKKKLADEGYDIVLVPQPSTKQHVMTWSFERVLDLVGQDSPFDGVFRFAVDGTVQDIVDVNATGRRATYFRDKLYMAGVTPNYNSANLRDFKGMQGYIAMWEGLIRDQADFVEIVTWNDYNEDSNLMPSRFVGGNTHAIEKRGLNRDESYLDVTAYFAEWYKSGLRPDITQDKLYFGYRSRPHTLTKVWDETAQKWDDLTFGKHIDQVHDDVADNVYVTAFLTEPAELEIVQGDQSESFSFSKGIAYADVPMRPGFTPEIRLTRGKDVLIDVSGRKEIVDEPTQENSIQASAWTRHIANRFWMSGAVVGEPTQVYNLDNQTLSPGAEPIELKTLNLGDKPYNFQLTYRNSGSEEARLTLYADGAPGAEGKFPYWFPLTLPPTGDAFKTISFIWSTWDANTRFQIVSDLSEEPKLQDADFNDYGEVTLSKLELIPVKLPEAQTVSEAKYPELVAIPGGEFIMGGEGGAPDELPAHDVTISPFAIGKYEVTNEEFERVFPEHRQFRDGYSWRNREPVIYVSWIMAVRYCNELSRINGLAPAYDEKTWDLVENPEGFRLPTEAEWEYVASGRGENRIYPWGNDLPTPDRGRFELSESLDTNPRRDSMFDRGVRVVGDFPDGASLDGVMDLAGNISEWCTDTYLPYKAGPAVDPVSEETSSYRVIRGGSWGYYNHSQRVKDREFNNPGYGGYIYLGFRVAISEAGLKRLQP